jgi:cobalt-zinc-cadmium efflux system outer membrane protein
MAMRWSFRISTLASKHAWGCAALLSILAGCEGTSPNNVLRPNAPTPATASSESGRQDSAIVSRASSGQSANAKEVNDNAVSQASAVSLSVSSSAPPQPKPVDVKLVSHTDSAPPQPKPANVKLVSHAEQKSVPAPRPAPVVSSRIQAGPAHETIPFSLTEAIERSLRENPDLVAMRGQLGVNQAMVGVAQTYPWNPFIQAQFFPNGHPFVPPEPGMPASGAGLSNYYIWVMQRFELAHQRQHRIRSAMAAMDQTQWNIFQGELLNVAQTARLYFATLYQKEVYELAEETADMNERLAGIVERRFKANKAKAGDVTTARVAARQARRQADLAEATYQAALLALHQQVNLPMATPLTPMEKLADFSWLVPESEGRPSDSCMLAAELVEGRPDVLAAQAGMRVTEANYRLARAAMIPDLSAGAIYETADDGTSYLGFRLQMDIPIWNSGGPLARQRLEEMNQRGLTYEQLRARATLEAQASLKQYERVRVLAAKMRPPKAGSVAPEFKEITSLFEAGQADIFAVLTTQTNLLQERRVYLDMLNQLAQTAAAVIQSTGLPPERVFRLTSDARR